MKALGLWGARWRWGVLVDGWRTASLTIFWQMAGAVPQRLQLGTSGAGCCYRLRERVYDHLHPHSTIGMDPPVQYALRSVRRDRDAA